MDEPIKQLVVVAVVVIVGIALIALAKGDLLTSIGESISNYITRIASAS